MEIKKLPDHLKDFILTGKRAVKASGEYTVEEILSMEVAGWGWLNELNQRNFKAVEFTEEELRHMYAESPKGFLQLTFEEYCERMQKVLDIENESYGYVELGDYIVSYIPVSDVEFKKRFPEGSAEMYLMFHVFVTENENYMGGRERTEYVSKRSGIEMERVDRYFEEAK